jgi:hypothetical protein
MSPSTGRLPWRPRWARFPCAALRPILDCASLPASEPLLSSSEVRRRKEEPAPLDVQERKSRSLAIDAANLMRCISLSCPVGPVPGPFPVGSLWCFPARPEGLLHICSGTLNQTCVFPKTCHRLDIGVPRVKPIRFSPANRQISRWTTAFADKPGGHICISVRLATQTGQSQVRTSTEGGLRGLFSG